MEMGGLWVQGSSGSCSKFQASLEYTVIPVSKTKQNKQELNTSEVKEKVRWIGEDGLPELSMFNRETPEASSCNPHHGLLLNCRLGSGGICLPGHLEPNSSFSLSMTSDPLFPKQTPPGGFVFARPHPQPCSIQLLEQSLCHSVTGEYFRLASSTFIIA